MKNFSLYFGSGLQINNLLAARVIIILNDKLSVDYNHRYGYICAIIMAFLPRIFKATRLLAIKKIINTHTISCFEQFS